MVIMTALGSDTDLFTGDVGQQLWTGRRRSIDRQTILVITSAASWVRSTVSAVAGTGQEAKYEEVLDPKSHEAELRPWRT
jgi:hypothetical protein